jgi:hypothetical protein
MPKHEPLLRLSFRSQKIQLKTNKNGTKQQIKVLILSLNIAGSVAGGTPVLGHSDSSMVGILLLTDFLKNFRLGVMLKKFAFQALCKKFTKFDKIWKEK